MTLPGTSTAASRIAVCSAATIILILASCVGGSGSYGGGLNGIYSLVRRSPPAIYASGKAVNFGPNRTLGPGVEFISDANMLHDLGLLNTVSTKIIDLASKNYPAIQFQLGNWIAGTNSSCIDSYGVNAAQISAGVGLANKYSNVVAVSIGNETSLTNNVPISCLAAFVTSLKKMCCSGLR